LHDDGRRMRRKFDLADQCRYLDGRLDDGIEDGGAGMLCIADTENGERRQRLESQVDIARIEIDDG
jgi:hypothetical protein